MWLVTVVVIGTAKLSRAQNVYVFWRMHKKVAANFFF